MHLCSAITWQLGGPRVQRANGGFLFSKNPPESRAPDGWPDLGGRERKGILSLKFLLHCTYLDHFFLGVVVEVSHFTYFVFFSGK